MKNAVSYYISWKWKLHKLLEIKNPFHLTTLVFNDEYRKTKNYFIM